MDSGKTDWGFPRGKVAATLRSILSKDFSDDDVSTIAVVLMLHSLVETAIARVIFLVLTLGLPHYGKGVDHAETDNHETLNQEMEASISDAVQRLSFRHKFELIRPCLKIWHPHLQETIQEIGTVRNKIAHLERVDDLKYNGKSIWSEEGIEEFFVSCQCAAKEIDKLWERIDESRLL